MRTLISVFSLLALSAKMPAQQFVIVTPKTFAGWMVAGTDHTVAPELNELTLPASAQAAHSFDSSAVTIKLTSNPVVGTTAADWPVLEIGNCDLVFSRSEAGGKLTLIIGGDQPIDLPFIYALDGAGRSTEPLALEFSRQGSIATVTVAGKIQQFSGLPVEQKLDVVASSGATQAWDFKLLEVVVGTSTTEGDSIKNSIDGSLTGDGHSTSSGKIIGTSAAQTSGAVLDSTDNVAALAKKLAAEKTKPAGGGMEVFTPPSIRHGRIDGVRSALSVQKSN